MARLATRGGPGRIWRAAALALTLLGSSLGKSAAHAAPLPAPMPRGYTLERDEGTRWLYPTSAEAEVAELKRARKKAWAALERELGSKLPDEIDLRVARNPQEMQRLAPQTVLPGYATGVAFPQEGLVLLSLAEPETFFRPDMPRVLVHELSHVALERAVGGRPVPRWFAEGVAIHQAGEHSLARVRVLWEGTLRGDLIPLSQLSASFPAEHANVDLAYAQAADLVGHMLEGPRGPEHFRTLIARLREGESFERAVDAAYGPLDQLERDWRSRLSQRFGRWPSILSGLTLMWVIGALLLVVGYVQVRRRHHATLKRWAIEEAPILAAEVPAAAPPTPPPPAPRHAADDVLDAWGERRHHESGIPTVVHEGRSYTLH
ncbi:MAG: peptidase MA family metallohydrolase [Polyangiales bacterium]